MTTPGNINNKGWTLAFPGDEDDDDDITEVTARPEEVIKVSTPAFVEKRTVQLFYTASWHFAFVVGGQVIEQSQDFDESPSVETMREWGRAVVLFKKYSLKAAGVDIDALYKTLGGNSYELHYA